MACLGARPGLALSCPCCSQPSPSLSLSLPLSPPPPTHLLPPQLTRIGYKDNYLQKKKAAKANISTLKNGLDVLKDGELRQLQEEFREIDNAFKAMGLMADKETLFEGAGKRAEGGFDPTRARNADLLAAARSKEEDNLGKLKEVLVVAEATKEQGKHTAATLAQDVEKIERIRSGLDDVQGELELSRLYITRILKRLATDKIIIAFAFLLVAGIIAVIVYSIVVPGQTTFAVPCVDSSGINANCGVPSVSATRTASPTLSPTPSPTSTSS